MRVRLKRLLTSNLSVLKVENADEIELDAAVTQMVQTRVCAAHAARDSCERSAQGIDLIHLMNLTRFLINARFLELLGFSNDDRTGFLTDAYYFGDTTYLEGFRRRATT